MSKSESGSANSDQSLWEEHNKKEVVVLVYHRFGNRKYPSTNISLPDFEQHLNYLKNNGFVVMNFGDAVDYITNPKALYLDKVACITVDDGYKTFISNGLPLLKKFNFDATLFINSESVGGGSFMNWAELKEVHDAGIEIGNHSHSHAYFVNKPAANRLGFFKEDVEKCQEAIKKNLDFYPDVFAYPYGEFDLEMKAALKELGFKAAAAQNSGVMYNHEVYAIPRFPMAGPYTKLAGFREKANMKALRIKNQQPGSFIVVGNNPPTLNVDFDSTGADLIRHSCFTENECTTSIDGNRIQIQAKKKLKSRRSLYKITAPAKDGKGWYWYSHLWIQPSIKE